REPAHVERRGGRKIDEVGPGVEDAGRAQLRAGGVLRIRLDDDSLGQDERFDDARRGHRWDGGGGRRRGGGACGGSGDGGRRHRRRAARRPDSVVVVDASGSGETSTTKYVV